MRELLPMILSIVLFLITLVIIITLRKADRRDRSIDLIKRYVAQHSEKLYRSGEEMKTMIAEVESRFYTAQSDAEVAIVQINEQKKELFSHLEDLEGLHNTIVQYHKVLTDLSEMTRDVETRTQSVKLEIEEVKQVKELIDNFNISIGESQEEIDTSQQRLHQSMIVYQTKIEESVEDSLEMVRKSFEDEKQKFLDTLEPVFQQMRETSTTLLKEINEQIIKVEQSSELLVNSHAFTLDDLKNRCEERIKEVGQQTTVLEELEQKIAILTGTTSTLEIEQEQKRAEFEKLQEQVVTTKEEVDTLEKDKETIEEEIEEALQIQAQLKKEEELSSLIEREKVDFPDLDDEEDSYNNFDDDEEQEILESPLVVEGEPLAPLQEEQKVPLKDDEVKKNQVIHHQQDVDEIEEGEEEISLEDDEFDL